MTPTHTLKVWSYALRRGRAELRFDSVWSMRGTAWPPSQPAASPGDAGLWLFKCLEPQGWRWQNQALKASQVSFCPSCLNWSPTKTTEHPSTWQILLRCPCCKLLPPALCGVLARILEGPSWLQDLCVLMGSPSTRQGPISRSQVPGKQGQDVPISEDQCFSQCDSWA